MNRPSAHRRGYGRKWRAISRMVLNCHPICQSPHCHSRSVCVDHRLALAKGGTNDQDNLRALCHSCHSKKTNAVDGGLGRKKSHEHC